MAGRRPKPARLRLLEGKRGHRSIPKNEAEAALGRPDKPDKLKRDASEEWDRLAGLLEGEERLTKSDGPMLTGAALAYEAALAIRRKLSGRGMPVDLWLRCKTGERMQWDQYRKFCNDLCLSPGTRARARTPGTDKPKGKLEAFLVGKARGA